MFYKDEEVVLKRIFSYIKESNKRPNLRLKIICYCELGAQDSDDIHIDNRIRKEK